MSVEEPSHVYACPVCGRRVDHDTVGGAAGAGEPQELICPLAQAGCGSQWRRHRDGRSEVLMRTTGIDQRPSDDASGH